MVSATTTDAVPIETAHEDMIVCIRFRPHTHVILIPFKHDAQLDYYGKRLATCSSDRTVKVFNLVDGEPSKSGGQTLKGCVGRASLRLLFMSSPPSHTGPVWQVAWAHPKFGNILASCSYDGQVLIWREQTQGPSVGSWTKIKEHSLHTASGASTTCVHMLYLTFWRCTVNSISWAPHELGAILACASSDGKLSVLTFKGPFHLTSILPNPSLMITPTFH